MGIIAQMGLVVRLLRVALSGVELGSHGQSASRPFALCWALPYPLLRALNETIRIFPAVSRAEVASHLAVHCLHRDDVEF